jgi:hypothetical protein
MAIFREMVMKGKFVVANFVTDVLYASNYSFVWPIPLTTRSKAKISGRSPAEIVGSNPTAGVDVCLLLSVVR